MLFIALLEAPQDLDGVRHRWLTHHHRLEAPFQGRIPLDVLAVFIQGGGADALQLAPGQGRLENIGSVDRPLSCTSTDQGVHLVDHEDHIAGGADLLHDLLEALLELTAILGAGHQQADIQSEHPLVFEDVRYVAGVDPLGQTLGNGGLTNARFADQDWVVLGATAKNLNHPLDLVLATHHRIELAVGGEMGEVAAEFVEGGGFGGTLATAAAASTHLGGFPQHANHLGAHLGQVYPEVLQHPGRHALPFTDQAQQQVLGADVVVTELAGLLQGELQHPLGPGREGDFHGHEAGTAPDDLLHLNAGVLEVHGHRLEHLGCHTGALANQTQEDLLGANKVVTKPSGLLLGQHDHFDGLLGKPLEHGPWPVARAPNLSGFGGVCAGERRMARSLGAAGF